MRAQLQRDLQENMEMVIQVQRILEQQQHLNTEQQAEREQHKALLKQQVQHLEEQLETVKDDRSPVKSSLQDNMDMMKQLKEELQGFKEGQSHFEVEAETSQEMLSDANVTISILTDQINNLEQSTNCGTTSAAEGMCSRLEGSTQQLQASFVRLQLVINGASKPGHGPLVEVEVKMNSVLVKLEERLATHPAALSEELRAREKSNEELSALSMVHSPDSSAVESFLERAGPALCRGTGQHTGSPGIAR
ncbi:hypothetical protein J4Q44_G00164560 [Coregonus suidteri]|uniref:Uncharacterized protein n=1 Tax=Coregonus suidteri TaxID=861788 RepID=A0AAN8LN20_9TELE